MTLKSSVIASTAISAGARPSTTRWPEISPMASTAGTVRPTVEVTAPRHRLIARWSWSRRIALTALMPSGVNTMAAMMTPPSAEGAPSALMPWSRIAARLFDRSTIGSRLTRSRPAWRRIAPLPASGWAARASGASAPGLTKSRKKSLWRPVWSSRKMP